MKNIWSLALSGTAVLWATFLMAGEPAAASAPPLITGLKNPESVCLGQDGRIYISEIGEFNKPGDGSITVFANGKAVPFATGFNDPKGLVSSQGLLYVADRDRIWRIGQDGKPVLFAPPNAFPTTPLFLNDLAIDQESGTLYASDSGDLKGSGGAVYRITPRGLVEVVLDAQRLPGLHSPNGLVLEGASHLLMVDFGTGILSRVKLATGAVEKIADGFQGADGLVWDHFGRLFISNWKTGEISVIPRPGSQPLKLAVKFQSAADLCLDLSGQGLLVPDMLAGTLSALPAQVPGAPVDYSPTPLRAIAAFPQIEWKGWQADDGSGKVVPFRPILLTHAGDGSGRIFVATQQGVIHTLPAAREPRKSELFLDLRDRVKYADETNEEGFLGLAFHPQFKQNGELFVFYTPKNAPPHTNVVSRFRTLRGSRDHADPASEQVLLRIEHPFWNHDGGTIAFGPDGFLYIALGDGGAGNDPFGNAQNLSTWLGKILRIDVNRSDKIHPYGIPNDNPYAVHPTARPEIYASGLRNVWRFAFDRETKTGWIADVGQNLYEEINLLQRGANYGWNVREGLHPFGARGTGPRGDLVDPVWEYHHDRGKSITGGFVYRGKKLPELAGHYLYADYITGEVYALKYDPSLRRVTANRTIASPRLPILSFGEDEQGEAYFLISSPTGQAIYRFENQALRE